MGMKQQMKQQLTDLLDKHGLNESIRIIMQEYARIERPDLTITWLNDADIESNGSINIDFNMISISEIYETMLALNDKKHKKNNGIYYTPDDAAESCMQWIHHQSASSSAMTVMTLSHHHMPYLHA